MAPRQEENVDKLENVEVIPEYEDIKNLTKLLKDNEKDLWPSCTEFTRLSFLLRLFQLKSLGEWTNKHFAMLFDILRKALPRGNESILKSYYEAKKIVTMLDLDYIKTYACPNDCIIYYKGNKDI